MKNVEVALYRAKSAGRGTFALFDPARDNAKSERQLSAAGPTANTSLGKPS